MKNNIGKVDRLIRIMIGGILFSAFIQGAFTGLLAIAALIVCAILMITSIYGTCPLYRILGINSIEKITNK